MKANKKNMKCLLCAKQITEDEAQFEDYYTVYRGTNSDFDKNIEAFICFNCYQTEKNI